MPGTAKSTYCPGKNLIEVGSIEPDNEVTHVVRDVLIRHDLDDCLLDRQPGMDHLLVVVEQFDGQVFIGMCPAEQRETFLLLVIRKGERRVPVVIDIVAVEDEGFARGALTFLAAVHEHDSLLRGGAQDCLVLVDLDLDAHWLEAHQSLLSSPHAIRPLLARCCSISRFLRCPCRSATGSEEGPNSVEPSSPCRLVPTAATSRGAAGAGRPAGPWRL